MSEEEKQKSQQVTPGGQQKISSGKSNKTLFIILGVIVGLMACIGIVAGIGIYFASKAIKKSLPIEKTLNGYKYKNKKSGAESEVGKNVKAPDNWPSDVPIYDGNIVAKSSIGKALSIQVVTSDDSDTILNFYKSEMKKKGWEEISSYSTKNAETVSYKKGTARTTSFSISKDYSEKSKNRIIITTSLE